MINFFLLIMGFILLIASGGCEENSKLVNPDAATIIVNKQANVDTLYLNGTIEPIKIINVIAPFDGTIAQQGFDYGALLKKQQLMLVVDSNQFNDSYQDALSGYLKAKRDYANNQSKLRGTEELKRLGIISNDDYMATKNQVYDSALALAQATRKLQDLLQKANQPLDFAKFNINDTEMAASLLRTNSQQLKIYSPSTGIALLPAKSSASDDANKPLQVGDQIKAGQSLLTIGDISGIILAVKIIEIHINDMQVGQTAIITSNAFKDTLQGRIIHVDQQATQDSSDSVPNFMVKIAVPTITDAQRRDIHVGMSAKIAVQITKPSAITVPISAIMTKNGQTVVTVLTKKTKQKKEVPVITGATSLDSVIIKQGLTPGDEVMINVDHSTTSSQ
jgi:HlyD family secretion protein